MKITKIQKIDAGGSRIVLLREEADPAGLLEDLAEHAYVKERLSDEKAVAVLNRLNILFMNRWLLA